jgi:hypothetical protein
VYTSEGRKIVIVEVETVDGRTATGRTEVFIDF